MPPDISIIIAAYNVERYIEKSIKSALSQDDLTQTLTLEVIVVDDGSTDQTWNIVSQIKDSRLKCFRLPGNSGPGAARNAAIAHASGRWIAILDGDDTFLPGRLVRLLKLATGRQADIAVDNLLVHREADGLTFPMFSSSHLSQLSTLSLADFIAGNQSLMRGYSLGYMKPMFSIEFLRRHKIFYDTALRIGEDYTILVQALAAGGLCVVDPVAGYSYTARAGSTSYRLSPNDILQIIEREKNLLPENQLPPAAIQAQRRRQKNLKEAYEFSRLIEALKDHNIVQFLQMIVASPLAARHLWRPVWARIQKIRPINLNKKGKSICPQ